VYTFKMLFCKENFVRQMVRCFEKRAVRLQ
jgi:hypothetical protein